MKKDEHELLHIRVFFAAQDFRRRVGASTFLQSGATLMQYDISGSCVRR